jgi:hypothetical protein
MHDPAWAAVCRPHSESARLKAVNHARIAEALRERGVQVRSLSDILMELGELETLHRFVGEQVRLEAGGNAVDETGEVSATRGAAVNRWLRRSHIVSASGWDGGGAVGSWRCSRSRWNRWCMCWNCDWAS